ncbi:MAG: acyl-CoA synthetase, partial [Myxococcales bacterium]|nr:acyl-CoA synthetase [Myxococcales bacterium]
MTGKGRKPSWRAPFRRVAMATENALELARLGHFTDPEHAPYKVAHQMRIARLRRYGGDDYRPTVAAPLLLIPPLMVTAEIYDVAPDISGVTALTQLGLDVWVIDFGSPEQEEGGMMRTLDDHIKAVSDAIDWVHGATGHDVHLVGYSQGGMFAYQTAAYRSSRGIASLVTFGSPVDIHRNL